jgi:hypothetical protein
MRTATGLALGLALTAGLLTPALAARPDEPVTLKWVLKEGDTFYAKSSAVSDMNLDVLGMNQDIKQTSSTVQKFKVKSAKAGEIVVEMTIVDMKMELDALPGFGDFADKLKGAVLTATFDDGMNVTKVEGYQKLADKLGGDDPMTKQIMQMVISDSTVKAMFGQVFVPLPSKPVKAGDTWTRTDKLPLSGLGDLTSKSKFTLDSIDNGMAKIKTTGDVTFVPGKGDAKGLPIKITKADLKTDRFVGTLTFDTKLGRLKESKQEMTISGSFTISAGGQEIEAGIKQKSTTTLTVTDKSPVTD